MTASDANRLRHMLDAAREAVEFGAGLALPLYPVERLQNLPRGVVQRDRASVGTAHGAIRGGQRAQQPFHFGGVQAGVDFDGGPAGDGGADAAPQIVERGAAQFGFGDFQNRFTTAPFTEMPANKPRARE